MSLILAWIKRDYRISLTHRGGLVLDAVSMLATAALFYYLGRAFGREEEFFAFAAAGIVFLRLHVALPRTLDTVGSELASGSFELLVTSRWPRTVVVSASAAYEVLRATVLAVALLFVAILLYSAPAPEQPEDYLAIASGLTLGAGVFAGLTVGMVGVLMVVRQARAFAAVSGTLMPILAGAYFPVGTLPEPLDSIASALPFRRVVDQIRDGLLHRGFDATDTVILLLETIAMLGLGLFLFRAGANHTQRAGSLFTE